MFVFFILLIMYIYKMIYKNNLFMYESYFNLVQFDNIIFNGNL